MSTVRMQGISRWEGPDGSSEQVIQRPSSPNRGPSNRQTEAKPRGTGEDNQVDTCLERETSR